MSRAEESRAGVDAGFWNGRRVLLTGHTSFKGSWLSLWLSALGAEVTGLALGAPTAPSLFELLRLADDVRSLEGDVRDREAVDRVLADVRPELVVHMAAQPIVRRSLRDPIGTYETNVLGTANVLDSVRRLGADVRAVINVTSDKCYENRGLDRGYREDDPLGGADPYSSSKACAELVAGAYRRSYFTGPDTTTLVSVRAGNVFGGGDWGEDRLIPDVFRAALSSGELVIRNPDSIRPWQHVLNPLAGYLLAAERAFGDPAIQPAFNFGPDPADERPVGWIVQRILELWPDEVSWRVEGEQSVEAAVLRLDSSLARETLGWRPSLGLETGIAATVEWYRSLRDGADMREATLTQVRAASPTPEAL